MRICSPQLGLSPQASLGGEVYDYEILTRLAILGGKIEVLLPAGLPYPQLSGLQVTPIPLRRGYRWFISNLVFVPYIGRLYRQRPFDVLRVHSLRFTGLAALWARRIYRLPVPIIAHHHHLDRDRWTDQLERRVAQAVDLIITGSCFSQQQLAQGLDIAAEKVAVVYYGVDERYRPGPADEEMRRKVNPAGGPILLHVGSLKGRKNLPVLLDAFADIQREFPDARLVLAGRGPEEAALQNQVKQLDIDQAVRFAGFVSEAEKLAYYRCATLFVSTSLLEGFGFAVVEAMACGCPVVVTEAGSLPEVVENGKTGLLVPVNHQAALSRAIRTVLQDEGLARQMADAGVARVNSLFRWGKAAERTLQLYKRQ
jgi:1,4-alpha-glucan branching enzyme